MPTTIGQIEILVGYYYKLIDLLDNRTLKIDYEAVLQVMKDVTIDPNAPSIIKSLIQDIVGFIRNTRRPEEKKPAQQLEALTQYLRDSITIVNQDRRNWSNELYRLRLSIVLRFEKKSDLVYIAKEISRWTRAVLYNHTTVYVTPETSEDEA